MAHCEEKRDDCFYVKEEKNDAQVKLNNLWPKEKLERFEKWFRGTLVVPEEYDTYRFGKEIRITPSYSLMEILEVRIISYSRKNNSRKLNIHGTITVDAGNHIFRRTPENPNVIHPQSTLLLTGPDAATMAYDQHSIKIDIKDGSRQICKGEFVWDSFKWFCREKNKYDKPLNHRMKGLNGFSAVVKYAIFEKAFLINVKIKLPTSPVNFYGRVDAIIKTSVRDSDTHNNDLKTTLFDRKHKDCTSVSSEGNEQKLVLSRSLIACPVGGLLTLRLQLRKHSPEHHIPTTPKQCVTFIPKYYGREKMIVESNYGSIVVKFKVYPADVHPPTSASAKYNFWRYMWPEMH